MTSTLEFARCCGYAVYAVAFSDKKIESIELQALHRFLNEQWLVLVEDSDPFGANAIECIEKMVESLASDMLEANEAINRFSAAYNELKTTLTVDQKQFIINCCIHVAGAFNRLNKSELIYLSRIEQILHS